MKIAKYDSKDKIQYGDNIENRSPASTHLMEVFTGSSNHTTNTQPEKIDLKLTDQTSPSPNNILNDLFQHSPLPYTSKAAAAAKVIAPTSQQRRINRLYHKINKMKPAFRRPDILDLKHELETLDTSTNTYKTGRTENLYHLTDRPNS